MILGTQVITGNLHRRSGQNRAIRVRGDQRCRSGSHIVGRIIRRGVFVPVERSPFNPQQHRRVIDRRNVDVARDSVTQQGSIINDLIGDRAGRGIRRIRSVCVGNGSKCRLVIGQRIRSGQGQFPGRGVPGTRDLRGVREDEHIFGLQVISGDLDRRSGQVDAVRIRGR